jgi:HEAT repeat protein
MVSWKLIENTIDRKNPMPRRKKGNKLLMALALNFGEHAFNEHKAILGNIQAICGDTNFIIRLDGVQFLNRYLSKNRDKLSNIPRLEQVYLAELYEFLHDEEVFIRIEAVEAISHIVDEIDTNTLEKELMPPLLKLLTLGVHEEVDLRMS